MIKRVRSLSRFPASASSPLVKKHLSDISRALLEGENKEKFAEFLREHEKQGLYALYRKNGELYYVGRASNLLGRLSSHRSDLHGKKWDKLAIYIIDEKLTLHDVESLLIAVSKPEGNKNRGRLKGDLKAALKNFMKAAANEEITASLYPNMEPRQTTKTHRITEKKIEAFVRQNGVTYTAGILGVSQGRISQLRGEKRLRQWVIAAGKREKLLLAIEAGRTKRSVSFRQACVTSCESHC
jgi:hypothetical protein